MNQLLVQRLVIFTLFEENFHASLRWGTDLVELRQNTNIENAAGVHSNVEFSLYLLLDGDLRTCIFTR